MTCVSDAAIGVDFGTTNTVVAFDQGGGQAGLAAFSHDGRPFNAFRSALSFHAPIDDPAGRVVEAGPWAIDAYVEDPLSAFLLKLREHGGADLADLPKRVIVGRPVAFAGLRPDPKLALARYETAFQRLGFTDIRYVYEPVAAAFFFARRLEGDATVLVGDFGGGTSDFSLVRFTHQGGHEIGR